MNPSSAVNQNQNTSQQKTKPTVDEVATSLGVKRVPRITPNTAQEPREPARIRRYQFDARPRT